MTVRFRQRPDLRVAELEGEGVVLHLGNQRYFTVSETGLAILEALKAPRTADEIVAILLETYEVSDEEARQSVAEFLNRCHEAELLLEEGTD